MASLGERVKNGWNAFLNKDPTRFFYNDLGPAYTYRPDKQRFFIANEKTIVSSIYTKLAIDVASISINHVKLDDNGRFSSVVNSGLGNCLTLEANIDQSARTFRQDLAQTLFEQGVVAVVPVDTRLNPLTTESYDIITLRVAAIVEWYPRHVKVSVYNDRNGRREELILPKSVVAIIENPLYSVMNEQNSTLHRLNRKLAMLDYTDEQNSSGKLDLIIQLPYVVKTETKRDQAEARRKDIEAQLVGSKYGIAYTDGTEKITQLNRPVENNLLSQIDTLKADLYNQLGLTEEIFKGTASEQVMLNYYNRSVLPVVATIAEEFKRKFLTKTARTQGHSIMFNRDPFSLVPVSQLADIADKFTRNEILSSNEVRQIIGYKPVNDPKADELRNKNMPPQEILAPVDTTESPESVLYDMGIDV